MYKTYHIFCIGMSLTLFMWCRVSELRVVELLDGLCDKMQDYTLQKVEIPSNCFSIFFTAYYVRIFEF